MKIELAKLFTKGVKFRIWPARLCKERKQMFTQSGIIALLEHTLFYLISLEVPIERITYKRKHVSPSYFYPYMNWDMEATFFFLLLIC